jgi:hypothetical protein
MNKIKSQRKPAEHQLTAALDNSVEAVVSLGVETDTTISPLTRFTVAADAAVPRIQTERKMYNPIAGP